jgi:hypothetical protein
MANAKRQIADEGEWVDVPIQARATSDEGEWTDLPVAKEPSKSLPRAVRASPVARRRCSGLAKA